MRWILILGLLTGAASAQAPEPVEDGFGMMATEAGEDFAEVLPTTRIAFPADHGPHPDFRIEWWYVTANLRDGDGVALGAQWTLFRFATRPGDGEGGWATPQIWMGHAALTTAERHAHAERFARGGIGQAGAVADPFDAWIDDWVFRATGDGFSPARLTARGE